MRSFNEVYEEIYKEKNEKLETARKYSLNTTYLTILAVIAIAIFIIIINKMYLFPFIFFFCIVGMFVMIIGGKKSNYRGAFKNEVIGALVSGVEENLTYYPDQGITQQIYINGEFEQHFDKFLSEDLIEGNLDNKYYVCMSEVLTQNETTDSEGKTTTTTIFHGMFGVSDCAKEIPGYIKIHSDKGFFGKIFGNKEKIEMDSSEFEKNFDVYCTNQIITMQILTADIMEMLIEFKKASKIEYELTLKGNQIYLRFFTGAVFEPNILKKSLDYNTLKRYYDIIEFIFKVTRSINKVIEETEI